MQEENNPQKLDFFGRIKAKLNAFFSRKAGLQGKQEEKRQIKFTGLNILANEVRDKEFKEIKKAKKRKKSKKRTTKKTVEELKKTIFELKDKINNLELDLANKKIGEEEFKRKMEETQNLLKQAEQQGRDSSIVSLHPLHEKIRQRVDAPRLERIEQKLDSLVEKHNVPGQEIQEHVEAVDVNKVLKSIDSLASMVELEKKSKEAEKLPYVEPEHFGNAKNKEQIKTIAMEIQKHKIITDVDKILSLVQEKKKIGFNDIKDLGISQKQFKEYADILKQEGLVELGYTPIGSLYLKYIEPKGDE